MNLAIVHYHLNRGGVTRVIENQLGALDVALAGEPAWRAVVLYGGRREGFNDQLPAVLKNVRLTFQEVPELDYDDQGGSPEVGARLADALRHLGFAPHETVVHVHNHALAKNVHLPEALRRLVGEGFPLLLQVHDFPEDFRPANYRQFRDALGPQVADPAQVLYPQGPQIHYAVLNGRDHDILQAAGVAADRLHQLPNPVPDMVDLPPVAEARRRLDEQSGVGRHQRMILYPVRAIRRKNIGEWLLYAALAPPDTILGLTLPPLNPAETPRYEQWKQLAGELDLPCRFDLGVPGKLSFPENLAAADAICTTSLAEGFGMVFLESWLAGRPLLGRDLPEITGDFAELGVRLDWLGPRLPVPVEWVGAEAFRQMIVSAYRRTLRTYGRGEPADLAARVDARIAGGLVDFGDLDEPLQALVLRKVCQRQQHHHRVLRDNGWLDRALGIRRNDVSEQIDQNAQAIHRHLSREPSGRRLLDLYGQVSASTRSQSPEPPPHPERILDGFLDFARFRPIRS